MIKVINFCKLGLLWGMVLMLSACGKGAGCNPAAKYAEYDSSDCTLCSIFRAVFGAVSDIAGKASNIFQKPVIMVTLVGFAVWLAVFILKYLATMETRDVKDVFQEMLVKGFQVVLAVVILNYGATKFYQMWISPVYETVLTAAQAAATSTNNRAGVNATNQRRIVSSSGVDVKPGGLPKSMGDAIINTMTAIENNVSQIRAFGSSLMCYSWERKKLLIIPNFSLLLSGMFFWVMAMVIIIILPFLMIDAVFQLAVAVALLPPAIGGYPFRATKIYSKKVWDIFLNSAFIFLFVSIVTLMLVSVLQITAAEIPNGTDLTWHDIMNDNEGKIDEYIDKFGWFHNNMIKFVLVFCLAWTVMSMGSKFADEFASSIAGTSIGSSLGTMGMSAAKGMAKKVGQPAGEMIGGKIERKAELMGQHIGHMHQRRLEGRQQKRFNKEFERYRGINGRDADGNAIDSYTKKRLGGLLGEVTVTRDANGNITREKTPGFAGKVAQKIGAKVRSAKTKNGKLKNVVTTTRYERIVNDNYVTERKVKVTKGVLVDDAGGENPFKEEKVISEKVLAKTQEAENILNEKGELDEVKIQKMMHGLNEKQQEQLQEQIAHKMLMQTWGAYDKVSGKNVVTERDGDIVRTIVTLPNGNREISEIRFPRGNVLMGEDPKEVLLEVTGAKKAYNGDDLQKYMDMVQKSLDDPNQAANFANIHEAAKEDLQKFVKGELVVSAYAYDKMAEFIDTFAGGYENEEMKKLHSSAMLKLADVMENQEKLMPNRIVMTKMIIRKNGHVTKLTSDGLYDRIDDFRIFDENDSRLERRLKRMARVIPGYHLYNNIERKWEMAQMNNIADVEKHAVRDDNGKIKMQTLVREGAYYSSVKHPEDISTVLPDGQSVNKFFHFTGMISGKEYGAFGEMNQNGEFIDKRSGQVIAQKKFEVDEKGNRYQVYLNILGDEYTIRTNSEGKNVKVTRNKDGSLKWGDEVTNEPKRELVIKYDQDKDGNMVERRLMLKDGMLSDVNGMKVYGQFDNSKMVRSSEERARFANYFK